MHEMRNCEDNVPKIDWWIKQDLTTGSHPDHWFDVFMPIKIKRQDLPQVVSVAQLTTWVNTKEVIYNTGNGGVQYPYFEEFLVEYIMQHIRVYMHNCVSPSPKVSYKFDSPNKNKINGSAIVNRVIEKNAHRRHRDFKSLFSC